MKHQTPPKSSGNKRDQQTRQRFPLLFEYADQMGVRLPHIARSPSRWPSFMHAPKDHIAYLSGSTGQVLWQVIKNLRSTLLIGALVSTLGSLASALVPWMIGRTLDVAITHGPGMELVWASLAFMGVVLAVAVADACREMTETMSWIGSSLGQVTPKISAHLSDNAGHLRDTTASGDVLTASETDAINIARFTAILPDILAATSASVLVAVLMLSTSLRLGLVVLIGMPILFLLMTLMAKPLQRRQGVVREEEGQLTTIAADAVRGLRILRGVGGEDVYARAYREQSYKMRDASIRLAPLEAVVATARMSMPLLFSALIVGQGALLTLDGQLTVGQLLAFYGFTAYLRIPIWILGLSLEAIAKAWVAARRVSQILGQSKPEVECGTDILTAKVAQTSTLVDEGGQWPLEAGKVHALIPANPQAHPQLATALRRFHPDANAQLHASDGTTSTYRSFTDESLRNNVTYLGATPHLFAATLRENLAGAVASVPPVHSTAELTLREALNVASDNESLLAMIDAEALRRRRADMTSDQRATEYEADAHLREAIDYAHAGDAVSSLDGGVDGVLTEGGRNLSGGQRQRLSLARAYVSNVPILLLEDPTSALDSHTEGLIAGALPQAREGKTTVFTTSSPLMMAAADVVHIIDATGSPVASGALAELHEMAESGNEQVAGALDFVHRGEGDAQ